MSMFQLELEAEIKYAYFFKGKQIDDRDSDVEMDEDDVINKHKKLLKKNYILVTKEKNIIIKNLGIKKKSNSPLSRKIFWEYLVPKIKEGQILFSKTYIKNIIMELLEKDLTLAAMRKEVGPFKQYEVKSPGSLPGQIAKKYGPGIHFLIPNTMDVGVGKGKRFCTMKEFEQHKMGFEHINLDNIWKELGYFIKPVVTKNIFDFGGK